MGEAEGDVDAVLPGQLAEPGDLAAGVGQVRRVAFAKARRGLEDGAVLAEHAADGEQFLGVGMRAGHRAPVGNPMQEGAGGGEAERAVADGLVDQVAHPRDVVGAGRILVQAALAHGVVAHGAMSDHPADVDALGHGVDGVEVFAVGLPVPRQARHDGFPGDVLHGFHELREIAAVLGLAGGEGHAAVAEHDGGNAVVARRRGRGIPTKLGVEVRVDVHEAGRHVLASGIDFVGASRLDRADLGHPVSIDGYVRSDGGAAGTVHHLAVSDHDVVAHGFPPLGVAT